MSGFDVFPEGLKRSPRRKHFSAHWGSLQRSGGDGVPGRAMDRMSRRIAAAAFAAQQLCPSFPWASAHGYLLPPLCGSVRIPAAAGLVWPRQPCRNI